MKHGFRLWMNAAIDGLDPVGSWELASEHNWFESVDDVPGLDRLVVIAGHSESQLCLDYREKQDLLASSMSNVRKLANWRASSGIPATNSLGLGRA